MTLRNLRSVFDHDTQFVLWIVDVDENELWMNNYLWGTNSIASMEIMPNSVFVEDNVVYIKTDMPDSVFKAWKEYSDSWEGR